MRGLKSTIALIVVLGGFGAYIYFVTWKQGDKTDTAKQDKVFVALEPDKIEEVKVKSEKGDTTTIKKENGAWQMIAPVTSKVENTRVTCIKHILRKIANLHVIDKNARVLNERDAATTLLEMN